MGWQSVQVLGLDWIEIEIKRGPSPDDTQCVTQHTKKSAPQRRSTVIPGYVLLSVDGASVGGVTIDGLT